jgi:multidrug efflux pump subunit AcrA (membrane-fusion protein)
MTGSLEDEIHRAREQANILAEEARVIGENSNERVKAANEGARKTKERLSSCKRNPAPSSRAGSIPSARFRLWLPISSRRSIAQTAKLWPDGQSAHQCRTQGF